jgi:hypothetical protein
MLRKIFQVVSQRLPKAPLPRFPTLAREDMRGDKKRAQ